jgi:predicted NodU family carbamoyl transferase
VRFTDSDQWSSGGVGRRGDWGLEPDQRFNGQEVWVAPATHDIGVEVSAAHRGFTHRTEANIDTERNKIANDLQAFQQVDRVSFVQRAPVPDATARGEVRSDWRVVVVRIAN